MAQVKRKSEKWMWITNCFYAGKRADLSITALDLDQDKRNLIYSVNHVLKVIVKY